MDCSPPGSSVHKVSQARIQEWVAISFSRGSSQTRNWTQVSCIAGGFFTNWAMREGMVAYSRSKTWFGFDHSLTSLVGEGNGTHSSTLAWKIPWMEEPGRLQSMGSLRVGHDWVTSLSFFTFMHWRRKWQPTPVFLPGESQGQGAWWAAVCGVAQSWTRLQWLSSSSSSIPGSLAGEESACNGGDLSSIPGLARSTGEEIGYPLRYSWASLVAQLVKNPPAMRETWVWPLGWEDPLEKGKATHSSIVAWRIPWIV